MLICIFVCREQSLHQIFEPLIHSHFCGILDGHSYLKSIAESQTIYFLYCERLFTSKQAPNRVWFNVEIALHP